MSLTGVQLVEEEDRQGSSSNSPRIDSNMDTITVIIAENDNLRGVLDFAVGEISVEEDSGQAYLEVVRTVGTFGTVGVHFVVSGVTATGGGVDFSPDTGFLTYEMDVSSQTIAIDIINDSEPELEEVHV